MRKGLGSLKNREKFWAHFHRTPDRLAGKSIDFTVRVVVAEDRVKCLNAAIDFPNSAMCGGFVESIKL